MFDNFERDDNYTDYDLYQYRSHLETLLTYDRDVGTSHLTNSFWYFDSGDLQPRDPTTGGPSNTGFVARWNRIKQRKEVQVISRLHSDIRKFIRYLFQFLEAYLIVNRIGRIPLI